MERPLKYILPMLEEIKKKADIRLMLSPWSPPARFKTNGQRHNGGKCRKEYLSDWAEYICRYIEEFESRGFTVTGISLQNEPHAAQTWDSCLWDAAEEREFLIRHMKPALLRHGLVHIAVYIWDHNKERVLERAVEVLRDEGLTCADGVAFHWCSGDHFDALRQLHRLFPEKKLLLSENCIEYSKYGHSAPYLARNMIAHELIGDMESGTNAFFDWNLVLDEHGGPNYAGNFCHAPYIYNTETKLLARQSIYDAFWHFAHFIPAGSRRILSSAYTSEIETTAFARSDGQYALVLHNRGDARNIFLSLQGELASLSLPARALSTVVIE